MELNLYASLCSLTAYRGLLERKPMKALKHLMRKLEYSESDIESYTSVFYALVEEGYDSLPKYIMDHLRYDESPFADAVAKGTASGMLENAAKHDIDLLNVVVNLPCAALKGGLVALSPPSWGQTIEGLPEWNVGGHISYEELKRFYQVNGCGWFARYKAFVWQNGELHPVPHPDFLNEEEMWGYQRQRSQVIENTRALMAGAQVNNVLLYGASGTGKSATVKAMLSMPEFEGLRLVEVPKEELGALPRLVRLLADRPQKFIIFIDDLSFDKEDKTFSSLKTILEGGLEPRPANVAVYCTSNRRHLVRQNFSDRNGDEIDANETIQDKTSLAERFGLRILFSELNKFQFIQMAEELAAAKGLNIDRETIQAEAVKWDVRHPSRSPRSANQFVASMMARFGKN